jgi:hypothetical protein
VSERTNAHNEKRKARFVAAGVGVADIKFAFTDFVGEGSSSCALCDHPIENLFRLEFRRPEGAPVVFDPVGCVCITDWVKAMPLSPEREMALLRIKEAEKRMREVKREREAVIERADAEKTAIATLENLAERALMERFGRLPLDKRTDTLNDIAKSVLRYGSFKSDKQKGFFAARLREAEPGSNPRVPVAAPTRPPTPATSAPRPQTLLPTPSVVTYVPECPKCRGETVVRQSARGPFFGCKNYPNCSSITPIFVPKGQQTLNFPTPPPPTPEAVARARQARAEITRPSSRGGYGAPVVSGADVARETGQEAEYFGEPDADMLQPPPETTPDYGTTSADSGAPF